MGVLGKRIELVRVGAKDIPEAMLRNGRKSGGCTCLLHVFSLLVRLAA